MTKEKNGMRKIFTIPFIVIGYFLLYKLYIVKMNAFGCFDDCFNYTAGYFIGKGKLIYTDFFSMSSQ